MKTIWKYQYGFQKNGQCSYFAVEIQASLWTAQKFSVETTLEQYRNQHHGRVRLWNLHMCRWKPELGILNILDWRTNELQNMSRNTDDFFGLFSLRFSYAENLQVQNMPKSYEYMSLSLPYYPRPSDWQQASLNPFGPRLPTLLPYHATPDCPVVAG